MKGLSLIPPKGGIWFSKFRMNGKRSRFSPGWAVKMKS